MNILPAIDLKDGQCVRLQKGDYNTVHKVAEDAVQTAKAFLGAGATLIHIDTGYILSQRVIAETGAAVQLGGGIRTMADVDAVLALGVKRVIIGSAAVKDPEFVREAVQKYGDKIAVGIDALDGTVRTEGWVHDSGQDFLAFAKRMESYGVKTLICTDIDKDGMLEGPNFAQLDMLRQLVSCEIIASGGVTTLEDVEKLRKAGIDAAIAGKAVYTGTLDLAAAIRVGEG